MGLERAPGGRVDRSFFYRGDGASGFFERDGSPRKKFFVYKALARMLETPVRLDAQGADTRGFVVLAGRSEKGGEVHLLLANYRIPSQTYRDNAGYSIAVSHLPWGAAKFEVKRYRVTATESLTEIDDGIKEGDSFTATESLPAPAVELIVLKRL
jgi:hypothetical protein